MTDIGHIRQRLQNLQTIEHLIRSMRAISAIRWRKARHSLQAAQDYARSVQAQLSLVVGYNTPLVRQSRQDVLAYSEHVALVIMASDHGLCGAFNTTLFRAADENLARWQQARRQISVITLGEVARRYYARQGENSEGMRYHLLWTHRFPLTHVVSFLEMRDIWLKIQDLYQQENIAELYVIYNLFISFGRYQPQLVRLLPPELSPINLPRQEMPLLGSDAQDMQQFLLTEHLALQLYLGLVESMVSEQGARLQAMDAAKTNIDRRSAELHRMYHLARQESITEEMLEIVSGANSMSDKQA